MLPGRRRRFTGSCVVNLPENPNLDAHITSNLYARKDKLQVLRTTFPIKIWQGSRSGHAAIVKMSSWQGSHSPKLGTLRLHWLGLAAGYSRVLSWGLVHAVFVARLLKVPSSLHWPP